MIGKLKTEYSFLSEEIESQIPLLKEKGITELSIHDENYAKNKKWILKIIKKIEEAAPDVFVSFLVDVSVIDREFVLAASKIYCSFDIPLVICKKGEKILFDKKYYAGKARLLNDYGIVFGFILSFADIQGDSLKSFMDRLDFAVQQYPNHIEFPQLERNVVESYEPKVTGLFSAKDIRYAREVAFACKTFYSEGRAVPWMLSVLKPLKIYVSKFFADFAEWQRCNNCDFKSGFEPGLQKHKDIEKMQILFLSEKYEEKNCLNMLQLISDVVRINGAMSRVVCENEESLIETSYNPDDLLGFESFDLCGLFENVCMEECKVRIFASSEGPDWEIIS